MYEFVVCDLIFQLFRSHFTLREIQINQKSHLYNRGNTIIMYFIISYDMLQYHNERRKLTNQSRIYVQESHHVLIPLD